MSAVDRAAEIVGEMLGNDRPGATYVAFASALADAGLLVTDEIQVVLNAVELAVDAHRFGAGINLALANLERAYLASRQP